MSDKISRYSIAALATVLWLSVSLVARQDHQEAPRDQWQRVTDIFESLVPVSHIADIGAGSGYFTTASGGRQSEQPARCYAVDVNPVSLRELKHARDRLARTLRSSAATKTIRSCPRPASTGRSLSTRITSSPSIRHAASDSRRAEAGWPVGDRRADPTGPTTPGGADRRHAIAIELVEDDLKQAGFEIVTRDAAIRDDARSIKSTPTCSGAVKATDWLLVARRPSDSRPFGPSECAPGAPDRASSFRRSSAMCVSTVRVTTAALWPHTSRAGRAATAVAPRRAMSADAAGRTPSASAPRAAGARHRPACRG